MRYKLIGQTKFILPVLIGNGDGTVSEHRFIKGREMIIDENQMTSHVNTFKMNKKLKVEEIDEPVVKKEKAQPKKVVKEPKPKIDVGVETPEVDVEKEAAPEEPPKKKRGRKPKTVEEPAEE